MNEKEELLKEWIKLKKQEEKAKEKRQQVEDKILKFYEIPKDKKSKTFKEDGYDIEIKKNVKVEVDQVEGKHLFETFKEQAPFKSEIKLDATKYNALKEIEPAFYKRCSEAVTFTQGKTSVKVVKK